MVAQLLPLSGPDEGMTKELTVMGFQNNALDPRSDIDSCIRDYCDSPMSGCQNTYNEAYQRSATGHSHNYTSASSCGDGSSQNTSCFFDICSNLTSFANGDIGGQGVCIVQFSCCNLKRQDQDAISIPVHDSLIPLLKQV